MQARMDNPAVTVPGAMTALQGLAAAAENGSVPMTTIQLAQLRASQINGCGVCVDLHARMMRQAGETEERLAATATWRHTPYFTDAERAALALSEATTRLSDRGDAVPDDVWAEATRHFDDPALGSLLVAIAAIHVWNLLNVATGQVAGVWKG